MSADEELNEKIEEYIDTKAQLYLSKNDEPIDCSIDVKSVRHILNMIEENDLIINWVKIVIVTHREIIEKIKTYKVEECYKKLLKQVAYYYVINPIFADLSEEEKIEGTTRIKSTSFQKLIQMVGLEWVQFLNYLNIIITEITYTKIQKILKREKNVSVVYIQLLRFILTYLIKMKNGNKIDVTAYSILKIFRMMDMNRYDLLDYLIITKLKISNEENVLRKAKLRKLERQSKYMTIKNDISMNEASTLYKLKALGDYAAKLPRQQLRFLGQDQEAASKLMEETKGSKEKIVKEINARLSSDDKDGEGFIEVDDVHKDKAIIRKGYVKAIIGDKESKDDVYEVPDYKKRNVCVSRKALMNKGDNDDNDYVYMIHDDKPNKNKKNILVPKKTVLALYKDPKSVTKEEEIKCRPVDDINKDNKDDEEEVIKAKLKHLSIPPLDKIVQPAKPKPIVTEVPKLKDIKESKPKDIEVSKPIVTEIPKAKQNEKEKEEKTKVFKSKKPKLITELNKDDKALIEYDKKKLIPKQCYTQITHHPGDFDTFNVKNHYDDTIIPVSKQKLKSKPITSYPEYIEITTPQKTKAIVNKKEFTDAIEKNDGAKPISLNDYQTVVMTEIDPIDSNIKEAEPHELELLYQQEEAKAVKKAIEKELTDDDNKFYLLPKDNFLVRKSTINQLRSKPIDKNDPDIIELVDHNNKPRKISKRKVLADDLIPFVEVTDDETNKKRYVKEKDLENGLADLNKDTIPVEDETGAKINLKKGKVKVVQQPKPVVIKQEELIKVEPLSVEHKKAIEKDLNDDDNEFYLLPNEQFLVRKSTINQLRSKPIDKNDLDKIEIFDSDNKPHKVSRGKVLADDLIPFVEVTDDETNKKHYIKKKDLENGLADANNDTIPVEDEKGAKINLRKAKFNVVKQPKLVPVKQEEQIKVQPFSIIRKAIEKELANDDNLFYLLPKDNVLVRKSTINQLRSKPKNKNDPGTVDVLDIDNKPRKIARKQVQDDNDLIPFVEVADDDTNKKHYIKQKDLEKGLTDMNNDTIPVEDHKGAKINLKKGKLRVVTQPKPVMLIQEEPIKVQPLSIEQKKAIELDLNDDDNQFYLLPREQCLVRKNAIKEFKEKPNEPATVEVLDNNNKPHKVLRRKVLADDLIPFVEVTDGDTNKNHYVKKKNIEDGLADVNKDIIPAEDETGTKLNLKKGKIRVVKQPKLPVKVVREEPIKVQPLSFVVEDPIEKDIKNDDNLFYLLPKDNLLVRKNAIKQLRDELLNKTKNEPDTVNVLDSDNKPRIISKRKVLAEDLIPFVEVIDDNDNRNHYVKTKDLENGLADKKNDTIPVENNKGAKVNLKRGKIRVVKQPKLIPVIQEEPIKAQPLSIVKDEPIKSKAIPVLRGEAPKKIKPIPVIKHCYVNVEDEKGKNHLIRKEYIPLIKNDQPKTPFDRYEIPDSEDQRIYVSKKDINKLNPDKMEEYVYLKQKDNNNNFAKSDEDKSASPAHKHFIPRTKLIKAFEEDSKNENSNAAVTLPEYDFNVLKIFSIFSLTKNADISLNNTEVVPLEDITSLPYQEEEKLMEKLNEQKLEVTKPNEDNELIQMNNINKKPILIRRKIIDQIHQTNELSQRPRSVFNVVNCANNTEDKINVSNIPTDLNDNNAAKKYTYTPISIPSVNNGKPIYVKSNQLKDCLKKAEDPRCKLDIDEYPSKTSLKSNDVLSYDFAQLERPELPEQEVLKPLKTMDDKDKDKDGMDIDIEISPSRAKKKNDRNDEQLLEDIKEEKPEEEERKIDGDSIFNLKTIEKFFTPKTYREEKVKSTPKLIIGPGVKKTKYYIRRASMKNKQKTVNKSMG